MKIALIIMLGLLISACANRAPSTYGNLPDSQTSQVINNVSGTNQTQRKVIRTGAITVSVTSTQNASKLAEEYVKSFDGYVEKSSTTNGETWMQVRVPAVRLDAFLDSIGKLGNEISRKLSGEDVTEQIADLDNRIKNESALRERLQQLLNRAQNVQEVLSIERELTRVQTELESLQGRLDRLTSLTDFSTVNIQLKPKRILGPLGFVGYGLYWVGSKLIFLR
jgi:hypothetical protein